MTSLIIGTAFIQNMNKVYFHYISTCFLFLCIVRYKVYNSKLGLYILQSSSLEHESRSIYLIQFVLEEVQRISYTKEKPKVKKITFTCSLQQLQELVTKLREATRLIQAIANNK